MAARRRAVLLAIAAIALSGAAATTAGAAIPASGTVAEGFGPSAITIGMPGPVAVARWHLVCAPGPGTRRCFTSLRRAINWVEINAAGRVESLVWGEGAWRTRKGVGLGSRIAAVRAAYGKALRFRANRTWTYMSVRRTVRGEVRVTGFLGRTKVGDVVQMYVTRERRRLLRIEPASVPAGAGFAAVLTDWLPKEVYDADLRMPWDRGFGSDVGRIRARADGGARLSIGATGILATALARRPAGTSGPIVAHLVVGGSGGRTAEVRLALPAPPSIAVSPATLPADGAATLTVTGAEPAGGYELDAEWTCPATGATQRRQGLEEDPIGAQAGGTVTAAIDASTINFGLFDEECAGPTPPDALPATLVLYRLGVGRGSASSSRERVASLLVTVSRV